MTNLGFTTTLMTRKGSYTITTNKNYTITTNKNYKKNKKEGAF